MLVRQSTIGALGGLCCYSRVLQERSGCCVGTAEYYRSTVDVLLQRSRYSRDLLEHSGGCVGTTEYCRSTRDAVMVQQSTV